MELPFHLKTLEPLPGALDILRFIGSKGENNTADVDEICDALDLSDRRFNKAIRRLVTKGYVQMDGDGIYRLTEQGQTSVGELAEYDASGGAHDDDDDSGPMDVRTVAGVETVTRRLVVVFPQVMTAEQPVRAAIGFEAAGAGDQHEPVDLMLRVSLVNGEPESPEENLIKLGADANYTTLTLTPGAYEQVRLRVEVLHIDNLAADIRPIGGLYVDAEISGSQFDETLVAYSADVTFAP